MTVVPAQIIPPNSKLQLVDPKTGLFSVPGLQLIKQIWARIVGSNQITPCTALHTGNRYDLTSFPLPPFINIPPYADYSVFTFVSPFTSTGAVTAQVNSLGILNVYAANGATQAVAGDVVINSLYFLIYNSNLNIGAGGFVLK